MFEAEGGSVTNDWEAVIVNASVEAVTGVSNTHPPLLEETLSDSDISLALPYDGRNVHRNY
jgi:hypothetical protein